MRKYGIVLSLYLLSLGREVLSQELYVFSEPASVMPARSLTLRSKTHMMGANAMYDRFTFRNNVQAVAGITGRLTLRSGFSWGNMQTYRIKPESFNLYSRYRILSTDDVHRHFRLAAYAEGSYTKAPFRFDEVSLMGDKSGVEAGLIATQLIDKLAISATCSHTQVLHSSRKQANLFVPARTFSTLQFSLSGGYLLFPRVYSSYRQTNLNFYFELLSQRSLQRSLYYVDAAPALQLIFASATKLNLGYRFQVNSNMDRMNDYGWVLTLETTWLGFFKKKS